MKYIYLVILLVINSIFINAQPLLNEWSHNVGGSNNEVNGYFMDGKALIDVDDDGNVYMVVGTVSTDDMAAGNHGYEDCIITKYSIDGTELWSKVFGGSDGDRPRDLITLSNGDFAIVGYSYSDDGDLPNHHGGADGATDGFIARFDKDGTLLWAKQYGGTFFVAPGSDYFYSCKEKENGDLIAVGVTTSQNGDLLPDWVTNNPSFRVGWFVEVSGINGDVITSKRVKSVNHNEVNENTIEDLTFLSDGSGYCTIGYQAYFLNGIHWVTKIDTLGDVVWENEIGSISGLFVYEASVVEMADGNIMVALTNGDQNTSNFSGKTDMWVVKLDKNNGSVLSETNFGGSDYEIPYKLLPDNYGNYYLGGYSKSTDGFAHGGDSLQDNFIVYLDESFDTLWTYRFGGAENDIATDLALGNNGDIYISGSTRSSDGFYSSNFGGSDAWIGKFTNRFFESVADGKKHLINIYPIPSNDELRIIVENSNENFKVVINDILGRTINVNYKKTSNEIIVDTRGLENGTYLLNLITDNYLKSEKIIVKH